MRFNMIPNILSGLRIIMAISFPFLSQQNRILILCLALLTEYLDGALARKFNWVTASGQILDPIADKILALIVGLTFVVIKKLSIIELLLISLRDLVAAGGFILIVIIYRNYSLTSSFRPNFLGKMTTAFQYLVFLDLLFFPVSHDWLLLVTGFFSFISAVVYTRNLYRTFR